MSPKPARKSRVRTGCLTCRSRKVKCDEAQPFCYNCTRLNRACRYQSPFLVNSSSAPRSIEEPARVLDSSLWCFTPGNSSSPHVIGENTQAPGDFDPGVDDSPADFNFVTGEWGDLFPAIINTQSSPGSSPDLPSGEAVVPAELLSDQDLSFSFFRSSVEPPFITPWDSINWEIMKGHISQLGVSIPVISAAIWAVETLYKGLMDTGDNTAALSQYFIAKSTYLSLLKDESSDTEIVLIATFLLCCFEVVAQQETVSTTLKQKDTLITRLEQWSRNNRPWSPVARRIISWLHLFHTKAMHLGGRGVLSPKVLELLQEQHPVPPLTSLRPIQPTFSEAAIYALHQSLFQFYYELQYISTRVSSLNRHHRPRGSREDEMKVADISKDIEQRLDYLWQGRPFLLSIAEEDFIQSVIGCSPTDLAYLVFVTRLCRISYHAEIIYHARGHGNSDSNSPAILVARSEIRDIISNARQECPPGTNLHPAYMWPLFEYSVESMNSDDISWALEHLELISDPWWNTSSIKALIADLTKEQLRKGGRVDSRYFCIDKFGIIPPFI